MSILLTFTDVGERLSRALARIPPNRVAVPLRKLALGSNPIGDCGCVALAEAMATAPKLLPRKAAMVSLSPLWSSARAQALRGLEILQLGDTSLGDTGAAALAQALHAGAMPCGLQLRDH